MYERKLERMHIVVRPSVKERFKKACEANGVTMTEVLTGTMQDWMYKDPSVRETHCFRCGHRLELMDVSPEGEEAWDCPICAMRQSVNALSVRVAWLEDTLRFYASELNYHGRYSRVVGDKGKQARVALGLEED